VKALHLVTQDGQPYGSVRLCCERCGTQVFYRPDVPPWTDDKSVYGNPPEGFFQCSSAVAGVVEVMES